jgi:ppGpp synthetase/RelA/SpoT-type nucleotidyltranferase
MNIVEEYQSKLSLLEEYANAVFEDLNKIFDNSLLSIQSITGRIKEPTSMQTKFDSKEKYKSLFDITDLVGLRVITSYRQELEYIKFQIERNFIVDEENINMNEPGDLSQFGYASLHFIVKGVKEKGLKSSNQKFEGLKCEIQTRTLLQHAWAETSHKIDYKSDSEIASKHKRKLFRIAALLELADEEFDYLRNGVFKNQRRILPNTKGYFTDYEESDLTPENLQEYVLKSNVCNILDKKLAESSNNALHYNPDSIMNKNFNQAKNLGIEKIGELEKLLVENDQDVLRTYEKQNESWLKLKGAFPQRDGNPSSPRGICITYLHFFLKGKYD